MHAMPARAGSGRSASRARSAGAGTGEGHRDHATRHTGGLLIDIPLFYVIAVPAVLLAGISKGGFGGGIGSMAVPLMALAVSPLQAAAVMLPLLCVMDLFGVWAYRGQWDRRNMAILVPAALLGIVIGAATFRYLSADHVRIIIGTALIVGLGTGLGTVIFVRLLEVIGAFTEGMRDRLGLAAGTLITMAVAGVLVGLLIERFAKAPDERVKTVCTSLVKDLHDFVVVKLSRGDSIDLDLSRLAPGGHNEVVFLVFGNGDVSTHNVADGTV